MDENQETEQMSDTPEPVEEPKTPEVGFPMAQPKPKGGINKLVIFALVLLLLIGGGIFLFSRGSKEDTGELGPTPTVEGLSGPTSTPTATPSPVDKADVSIEIQNGTGITGEAAYLQGVLKSMGYSDIKAGNAAEANHETTTVTFAKSLSSAIVDEITKKLESIYDEVDTKISSTQKTDVLIVTGLKKGATPKPTSTPTSTPTTTPTTTTTPTASPTATSN